MVPKPKITPSFSMLWKHQISLVGVCLLSYNSLWKCRYQCFGEINCPIFRAEVDMVLQPRRLTCHHRCVCHNFDSLCYQNYMLDKLVPFTILLTDILSTACPSPTCSSVVDTTYWLLCVSEHRGTILYRVRKTVQHSQKESYIIII